MLRLLALGGARPVSKTLSLRGKQIHYLEAGEGETVLLLHGAGGGAANWYRLIEPLARTYHVISVDLPGFGLSDAIAPERPLGRQVAGFMEEWLAEIDVVPAHIVGTSFGGLVGARLAQRLAPASLVLIDAAGLWPDAMLGLRLTCNRIMQRIPLKQTRSGTRWLLRNVLIAGQLATEDEEALADYLYWSNVRTDPKALARAYTLFAGMRGQAEVLSDRELQDLAPRTLILWGEKDRFLPLTSIRRAAALAAGVQLHIIPAVGHSPNWEAPEIVLREVARFLGRDEKEESARPAGRDAGEQADPRAGGL